MTRSGTGWPGPEFPQYRKGERMDESYTEHVNSKLPQKWCALIEQSGDPISQWIREAVRQRLLHEGLIDE